MATRIIIIGGGPGGYVAAIRASQLGGEVTLIEKDTLGGTCLNVGCIPTKALLHWAELYKSAKHGERAGVTAAPQLEFSRVQASKRETVQKLVEGVSDLLRANKVAVIQGEAAFLGPQTITVRTADGAETRTADKIIIATGSIPASIPIPGLPSEQYMDSTGALNLPEIPSSLAIIGGGVIGVEIATIYASFGSKVTIVEMLPGILPSIDPALTRFAQKGLASAGTRLLTSARVTGAQAEGGMTKLYVEAGGKTEALSFEKVLVCVGRQPNTASLCLEKAGVRQERGAISVDDRMQTNVRGIYAIGDCTGGVMLAHVASQQGEVAAENALGHASRYDGRTNPSCVYSEPEIAVVGMQEAEAKAKGIACRVGQFPLTANGKSIIMNEGAGMVKLLIGEKYGQVMGVGIAGPRATDLIAEAALAIRLEATADELTSTIHAHPTVSEALREAAMAAQRRPIHTL